MLNSLLRRAGLGTSARPAQGGAEVTFDHTIQTGAEAFTLDGIKLGVVAELRGGAFRIDSELLPHYWLPTDSAAYGDARSLRLAFEMRDLVRHLIPEPPAR